MGHLTRMQTYREGIDQYFRVVLFYYADPMYEILYRRHDSNENFIWFCLLYCARWF